MSRSAGNPGWEALEERLRIVRRDLEELAQQVADGEISPDAAAGLEAGYRQELAEVEAALADRPAPAPPSRLEAAARATPGGRRAAVGSERRILWVMGVAILALTGVIVFLATRGSGGQALTTPPADLPTDVPAEIAEMEAALAANPDAEMNAMRIALADWYLAENYLSQAGAHYLAVLHGGPTAADASEALTGLGWIDYLNGNVDSAIALLEEAGGVDPAYGLARLLLGVVLLYGAEDAEAALPLLEEALTYPDLSDEGREDLEQMIAEARAAVGGGEG